MSEFDKRLLAIEKRVTKIEEFSRGIFRIIELLVTETKLNLISDELAYEELERLKSELETR